MSDNIVERLKVLCDPRAECLSDGTRITQFVKYGTDARHEITRLNADLAAVTAERDRMREALKLALEYWKHRQSRYKNRHPVWVQTARAAIEGVTEPASPWRDIESAPRNGRVFLAINNRVGPNPRPKGYNPYFMCYCLPPDEGVTYASDAGWHTPGRDWPCYPTHWMPLPEPPANTQTGER